MGRIVGILAIKNYLGVSESTVMDMIHNQGMPAIKNDELNVWEIDQARLDRWRADPERDAKMAAVSDKTERLKSDADLAEAEADLEEVKSDLEEVKSDIEELETDLAEAETDLEEAEADLEKVKVKKKKGGSKK
jgi:multidrug resistance efflux pump